MALTVRGSGPLVAACDRLQDVVNCLRPRGAASGPRWYWRCSSESPARARACCGSPTREPAGASVRRVGCGRLEGRDVPSNARIGGAGPRAGTWLGEQTVESGPREVTRPRRDRHGRNARARGDGAIRCFRRRRREDDARNASAGGPPTVGPADENRSVLVRSLMGTAKGGATASASWGAQPAPATYAKAPTLVRVTPVRSRSGLLDWAGRANAACNQSSCGSDVVGCEMLKRTALRAPLPTPQEA